MFYIFRDYGFIDIHCYLNALVISLETIATVGYTVTDISFSTLFSSPPFCFYSIDDQPIAFCLLFCEMMQSILMNSFCIGVVYARLSRAFVYSIWGYWQLDSCSFDYLQPKGHYSRNRRRMVFDVPGMWASKASVDWVAHLLLHHSKDSERHRWHSLPTPRYAFRCNFR